MLDDIGSAQIEGALEMLSDSEKNRLVGEGLIQFLSDALKSNADPGVVGVSLNKLLESVKATGKLDDKTEQNFGATLANLVIEAHAPTTPVRIMNTPLDAFPWSGRDTDNFMTSAQRIGWKRPTPQAVHQPISNVVSPK